MSLHSTMGSIVGFFIITRCLTEREDIDSAPALPVLGKFCFELRK